MGCPEWKPFESCSEALRYVATSDGAWIPTYRCMGLPVCAVGPWVENHMPPVPKFRCSLILAVRRVENFRHPCFLSGWKRVSCSFLLKGILGFCALALWALPTRLFTFAFALWGLGTDGKAAKDGVEVVLAGGVGCALVER